MTGTMRAIEGPQYSAPPSCTKSSIMSTTRSARFIYEARVTLGRAGLRGAGLIGGAERLAASAARNRVRVAKREASTHQGVDEVDLRSLEVHGAHRVDDDANAVLLHDRVILFGAVGEGHPVREPRASTRRDVHAQREVLPLLLREHLAELVRRFRCQGHEWGLDRCRALLDGHRKNDSPRNTRETLNFCPPRLRFVGISLHHAQVFYPPGEEARARKFYGETLGLEELERPP